MKKNLFVLSLVVFCLMSLKTIQNNNDEILINTIVSEIVNQDSSILNENCKMVDGFSSPLQIHPSSYLSEENFEKLSPYFKAEDKNYYSEQIAKNRNIKLLKKNSFKSYDFISKKKITNFIAKVESDYVKEKDFNYNDRYVEKIGIIQEFGLPLISKDGKYLMLRFYCKLGPEKSRGFQRIYEKRGSTWVVVKSLLEWDK